MDSRKFKAAFMGPIVCELDGPGPFLKMSNTDVVMYSVMILTSQTHMNGRFDLLPQNGHQQNRR
jgi:hypothetical protein